MTPDKGEHGKKKEVDDIFTLKRMSYMFSVRKGKLMKQELAETCQQILSADKNKLEIS